MTSAQVTAINTALETTGGNVLEYFISVLPAIGTIIGIVFVISFVVYWLKKLRKVK